VPIAAEVDEAIATGVLPAQYVGWQLHVDAPERKSKKRRK
jgi:hypothetical protein